MGMILLISLLLLLHFCGPASLLLFPASAASSFAFCFLSPTPASAPAIGILLLLLLTSSLWCQALGIKLKHQASSIRHQESKTKVSSIEHSTPSFLLFPFSSPPSAAFLKERTHSLILALTLTLTLLFFFLPPSTLPLPLLALSTLCLTPPPSYLALLPTFLSYLPCSCTYLPLLPTFLSYLPSSPSPPSSLTLSSFDLA